MREELKRQVGTCIDRCSGELTELADTIWNNPEYNFKEYKACRSITGLLEKHGFEVERGTGGIETAFHAFCDSGKPGPHIAFLAEYDAVPGMGHACGHNLMAAMSAGAGIAVKSVLPQLKGSISVFGTPAEEGGGGKVIMLENGAFNGVDAAMIIHSANETVVNDISYSRTDIIVDFFGKGAHAATWPEEGVSALDPLLLLFQHISQMRLRWNGQGTILGIISEGGEDPIHIPEHCQGKFTVRSFSMKTKKKLLGDFLEACEAAARMTGTTWQWKEDGYTYEDIRNNPVIEDVLAEQFTRLGETVMPRRKELGIGCTDVGNLPHAFPALQSYVQVVPLLRGHTKEFEDACKSPDGHRAALTGAKALAMTAVELLSDDSLMEQVDRAFQDMKKQYE